MRPTGEPPRDFVDRLMRGLLGRVDNLADFLRSARPALAANFAFERGRPDPREFILEDWRRREADLLFEIPYRWGEKQTEVLVWVLLEHQSDTDTVVPLRFLLQTVLLWARQWQAWTEHESPRPSLRLQPVVPIVLYTATRPWGSNRTLRDLVAAPPELLELLPDWGPIFWNLSEHSTEELLGAGPFLQLLAVLRARELEMEAFRAVYRQASANLAPLAAANLVRWQELLHGLLSYGLWQRPGTEHPALVTAVRETNPARETEVTTMSQTMADYLLEQGEARGELRSLRRMLRWILEQDSGPLSEAALQRIEACNDVQKLEEATRKAHQGQKWEDLHL
jgi:hypothetical protein